MWQVNKVPTARYSVGTAIADLCGRPNSISKKEWATVGANAHLIAAAPDLLAMLVRCSDHLEQIGYSNVSSDLVSEARAAISKAKGVSK